MSPPSVPALWWDGCQFYADTGAPTPGSVDSPYEGRYTVMFLHGGHWAHQGNTDEVPGWAVQVDLPAVEVPDDDGEDGCPGPVAGHGCRLCRSDAELNHEQVVR